MTICRATCSRVTWSASVDIVPESVVVLIKSHMVFTGLVEWISSLTWVKGILTLVSLESDIHLLATFCLAHTFVAVRAPPYEITPLQITEPRSRPIPQTDVLAKSYLGLQNFPGFSRSIHTKVGSVSPFRARCHRSRFWLILTRLQLCLQIKCNCQPVCLSVLLSRVCCNKSHGLGVSPDKAVWSIKTPV